MDGSNDFGRLLCEPDMSEIKALYRKFSVAQLAPGIVLTIQVITLLTDFIDAFVLIFLFSSVAAFSFFISGLTFYQSLVAKLQIYENGFIDHYYHAGASRTVRVKSYYVEYDYLYGKDENDGQIIVIRAWMFRSVQKIFDEVVDILKSELGAERFPVVQDELFDDLAELNDESIKFSFSNVDTKYEILIMVLVAWVFTSLFLFSLTRDIMDVITSTFVCMPIFGLIVWITSKLIPWHKPDIIKIYPDKLLFWPYSHRWGLSVTFSTVYQVVSINHRFRKRICLAEA